MGVDDRACFTEQGVAAGLVCVMMGVEQRVNSLASESGLNGIGQLYCTTVNEQDAVGRGQRQQIAGGTFDKL
jgi:hypothetical protein